MVGVLVVAVGRPRGGVAAHYFDSDTVSSQFKTPLLGWQGTWTAGLGYEWQIPDTRWRLHATADTYYSLAHRRGRSQFFGVGLAAGAAYTF